MLKQVAIVGGALVAVGFIGMAVTAATGHSIHLPITINGDIHTTGFNFSSGKPIHEQKTLAAKTLQSVTVDADVAAVEVVPGKANQASVVLSGRSSLPLSDYHLKANVSGTKLNVSLTRTPKTLNTGSTQNISLKVTIPQQDYKSLVVHTDVGKVDMHNLSAKNTSVHVQTGKVSLEHIVGPIKATSNVGEVDVSDSPGPLQLTSNTGEVKVTEQQITKSIDASTNIGAVSVSSSKAPQNLGFDLQANIGRVSVNLPGAQYNTQTTTHIQGYVGNGKPQITASSNTGAVTLR